jgi:HK97 family phage prohead protease
MSNKTEIRTIGASLRAAANGRFEINGTAASYNVLSKDLGGFRERIAPGAFTRSLQSGEDVKCLFNHDANQVLGRLANGTLTLNDTPSGLQFCCRLNPDSQAHRDLHASIKRGDISECSFAFNVDGDDGDDFDEPKDENGQRFMRRTVKRAKLFDVSAVTNPAYGGAATTVSARKADYLVGAAQRVSPARRKKSYEEEYFERTGREYKCRDILRAKADAVLAEIRRDERRAEEHFIATASAAELLKALEAKIGKREQPGAALAPGAPCCTACTPDQHSKAATYHRTLASKAASWQEGAAHHTAADCHAKAAEQFNADNSVAARSASEKCLDEYGDDDQEDEY